MNKKQTKKILQAKKTTGKSTKKNKKQNKKAITFNTFLLIIIGLSILLFTLTNVFNIMNSKKTNDDIEIIYDNNKNQPDDSSTNPTKNEDAEIIPTQNNKKDTAIIEGENDTDTNIDSSSEETGVDDTEGQEKTKKIILYFIKIDEKGTPILIKEERLIAPTIAILTSTIKALLQGTSNTTASSYIPTKSVLQHASVSQGIATLDFNENFQYNDFGTAGILAQLYQIVYTCTEIAGIEAVQITINNKKIVYLGGEGNIQINKPLTRAYIESF